MTPRDDKAAIAHLGPGEGRSVWLLGELYTFKLAGEETGGAFALIEQTIPPGTDGPPPHRHRQTDETFSVLEGEMEFVADGTTVRAGAGSVVHVPRGVLHTYRNIGPGSVRQLVLITPAGFERFFLEAGEATTPAAQPTPTHEPPDVGRLLQIARRHDLEIPPPPGG